MVALNLSASLRERGHEVDVISLDSPSGLRPDADGDIQVSTAPIWARGKRLRRLAGVHRHLRQGSYDVVLAHTFLPNLYVRAAVALGRLDVPVVVALHSGSDDFASAAGRTIERQLLSWTSAVVTVNPQLLAQYREYFSAAAGKVHVIPNGVPKSPRRMLATRTAPRAFAVIGRISRVKHIETAIRGFGAYLQHVGDGGGSLRIIGPSTDFEYAKELRRLACDVNPGAITFEGARRQPFESYPIDVLIHSASYEAHPVTLLEASARGIPVVCTEVSSVAGAVDWHCTTFKPNSAEQLAQALLRVRREWPKALETADRAREVVPAISEAARRYELLLEEAVREGELGYSELKLEDAG
jgi:amylovoran biosynthesis glycosyltransferase AmsD